MVPFVNGENEESVNPKASETAVAAGAFEGCEGARPLRADAQRNRLRVLEAAEAVFAAEGLSVPIDVIAEKAGVGVGTLYRHFPTKEKLFEAIVIDRITALAAEARCRAQNAEDPGAAFFGFLDHMVEVSSSKRDLILALAGAGVEFEVAAGDAKEELKAGLEDLLSRAQATGAVRADVTVAVVMSLVGGACMAGEHPGGEPAAIMAIVCDGLRAQPSA
jgi:AcrR family transcriptional regulator